MLLKWTSSSLWGDEIVYCSICVANCTPWHKLLIQDSLCNFGERERAPHSGDCILHACVHAWLFVCLFFCLFFCLFVAIYHKFYKRILGTCIHIHVDNQYLKGMLSVTKWVKSNACLFTHLHFCSNDKWSIQWKRQQAIFRAQVGIISDNLPLHLCRSQLRSQLRSHSKSRHEKLRLKLYLHQAALDYWYTRKCRTLWGWAWASS